MKRPVHCPDDDQICGDVNDGYICNRWRGHSGACPVIAVPSGERPLWLIVGLTLAVIAWLLSGYLRPSRHERSIYRHHREKEWRE